MQRVIVGFLILSLCGCSSFAKSGPVKFMDGDIVFHKSKSAQSPAVALATRSPYTHVGLITMRKGEPYVLEAVGPVRVISFERWKRQGIGQHVVVKRLKDRSAIESKANQKRMAAIAKRHMGKDYDGIFAWDDREMYCSELVYRVFLDGAGILLGKIERFRDLDLSSPEVKHLVKIRRGNDLDLAEPIVTPASIFDDPQLGTVVVLN